MRRAEHGYLLHHHIAGPYLNAYASEISWREDNRRISYGQQYLAIADAALKHPMSRQWWVRSKANRARQWAGAVSLSRIVADAKFQPTAFDQVFLIQSAAAVDSLWPCPGFGQLAGAVILRIGIVMTRSVSQVMNGYSGLFLLNPVTASL